MVENSTSHELSTLLQSFLEDLHQRQCRQHLYEKLLHLVGAIVTIVASYVFFLIYTVTTDMGQVTHHLETMSKEIVEIHGQLYNIDGHMKTMNQEMTQSMKMMNHSLVDMSGATYQMSKAVQGMQTSLQQMNSALIRVSGDMSDTQKSMLQVSEDMANMQNSMLQISNDITSIHDDFEKVDQHLSTIITYGDEIRLYTGQMSQGLGIMAKDVGALSHHVSRSFRNINQFMPW